MIASDDDLAQRDWVEADIDHRLRLSPIQGAWLDMLEEYRYLLWRGWDWGKPWIAWVGLNPSTADAFEDDPTIRRVMAFTKDWGFGGIWMVNLFALRSTDPKGLKSHHNPVGIHNNLVLAEIARRSEEVICCWGAHGSYLNRSETVRHNLRALYPDKLRHLGLTKAAEPRHPLYLAKNTQREILG